ncbi:plastocyanin/azurin family copper-binding protein [Streptomyces sp. NPDC047043]|uniref:plastocyanin/azurin family copper-binding protein n=1 Tax=Streptomyces sp. NPDC047043 TaxID=3154497 RepID=UPI0033DE68E0
MTRISRKKFLRPAAVLTLLLAAPVLAGCGTSSAAGKSEASAPPPVVVNVRNMSFTPSSVTVRRGQKVVWKFDDGGVPHDVVGDGGLKSELKTSGSYTHTFTAAGTFHYTCSVHSAMMTGTVTVR